MLELGLIRSTSNGSYHILPLLQKSIEKCSNLIDFYMKKIDGQKISMPLLTSSELWKKSGRFNPETTTEILTTKDRHDKIQILSPTHEESVTSLIASISPSSYKNFPLRLYQIGTKFRDEFKPRFGLIRGREFLMKDMYTFDINYDSALESYEAVNDAYNKIFQSIGIKYVKVEADTGIMGGKLSHEYHYPAKIGEDHLIHCEKCNFALNAEKLNDNTKKCKECNDKNKNETMGIEIGHTFLLDDRYSKLLNATCLQSNNKSTPLIMGCYGIGISRIIPAALEVLSNDTELRWPFKLAPYKIMIIPPKLGSKINDDITNNWINKLYQNFNSVCYDDVIIDDRINLTIGKRLLDAKRMGYPIIVVLGSKILDNEPKFELFSIDSNTELILNFDELLGEIHRIFSIHNTFI